MVEASVKAVEVEMGIDEKILADIIAKGKSTARQTTEEFEDLDVERFSD